MNIEEAITVVKGFSFDYVSYKLGGEFAYAVELLVEHCENSEGKNDS